VKTIVFDVSLFSFAYWARHRLHVLGFKVVACKSRPHVCVDFAAGEKYYYTLEDFGIAELALKLNGIVVSTDPDFRRILGDRAIVLPHRLPDQNGRPKNRRYEEWWTILAKELGRRRLIP